MCNNQQLQFRNFNGENGTNGTLVFHVPTFLEIQKDLNASVFSRTEMITTSLAHPIVKVIVLLFIRICCFSYRSEVFIL